MEGGFLRDFHFPYCKTRLDVVYFPYPLGKVCFYVLD